jgi:transcriptional regulator with XRE-family HTH domain
MDEPMYEFVMAQLEASKGTWPSLASATGISRRTIEKIARREIADPGVSHIQRLADHFRGIERAA